MRRALLLAITCSLFAASRGGAEPPSFGRVTTLEMPRGRRAEAALLVDLDGDGGRDLIVAAARGGKRPGRALHVHLRRPGDVAFGPQPDLELPLLPDVVGFAVADVHADEGAEVVLFAATGAFALRWRATEERDRYAKLCDAEVLWQLPHQRKTLVLQDTVADVDGNGLADLLIPEPGGYRAVLQRDRDGVRTFDAQPLRLPDGGVDVPRGRASRRVRGEQSRRELRVSVRIGGGEAGGGEMVSVAESTPAPQLVDWNGDGRVDVLAQTTESLLVWIQAGGFRAAPDVVVPLPLEVDRRRLLDVSYAALTSDLDGDRRADYVLVAGDQDADEPRAQVALYTRAPAGEETGTPLFGERGVPSQLLIVAGVAGSPELVDVDGDGLADLVLGAVRFDALDALRAATGSTIDAELYVYLNRRGRFSKRPDMTGVIAIEARGLRRARSGNVAQLLGDVTGDGVSELLVRDDPERVRLLMVRRTREGLALVDRPLWETVVDDEADLYVSPPGDGPPELAVVSGHEVLHVRFGR